MSDFGLLYAHSLHVYCAGIPVVSCTLYFIAGSFHFGIFGP